MSLSHIALAVFVTTLWGFTFVVMRDLLDALPPLLISTLRVVAAGLPVLVLWRVPRIPIYWLLLLGGTQGVIQMSLLLFGMQFGMPAGLAALVLQTQVVFTTLLAFLLLREKPAHGGLNDSVLTTRAQRVSPLNHYCGQLLCVPPDQPDQPDPP